MTHAEMHIAIESRFVAQVATPQTLWTIFDNQPKSAPTDGRIWCRFTTLEGEGQRITSGTHRDYRYGGTAIAQLFGPLDAGDGGLLALVDVIRTAFRGQSVGGIRYGTPRLIRVGNRTDDYQINVEIPWQADDQEV